METPNIAQECQLTFSSLHPKEGVHTGTDMASYRLLKSYTDEYWLRVRYTPFLQEEKAGKLSCVHVI